MVFRKHDRKLFAALEAAGGTAETITPSTDYIETSEPTFTVTPLFFERMPKSSTQTMATATVPGTADTTPVSQVEFSFGVELAGPATGLVSGTAPSMGTLLQACGMAETATIHKTTLASVTSGPFFNKERASATTGPGIFSDTFFGDSSVYANAATDFSSTTLLGAVSGAGGTAGAANPSRVGVGYMFDTARSDSGSAGDNASSLTIRLYLDASGTYIEGKGMRGTAEFAFVHGDRVLVSFTFTGVLSTYVDGSGTDVTGYTASSLVPPAFIAPSAGIQVSSTASADMSSTLLFNSMTISLGNEVTVRESTNAASGFSEAIITGRTPTFTFNPDATLATTAGNMDFWNTFLSGVTARMSFQVGATATNIATFKMPALQFSGISDGDRDTVMVLDSTCNVTGGNYGSSLATDKASTRESTDMGYDNELAIIFE